ncbi:MAG: hypothetical protein AAGF92_02185 [Myxococcota bacterium]
MKTAVLALGIAACGGDGSGEAPFVCEEPLGAALPMVPAMPIAGYSPDACLPGFSALLVNESDEAVRVERFQSGGFGADPDSGGEAGRLIATAELPRELGPLDGLSVELQFFTAASEVSGRTTLEVLTSEGCQRFSVISVRDGETGNSHPLAVDLGVVGPGERSELVDVVFTSFGTPETTLTLSAGLYSEVFEVVDPIPPTMLRSCEPLRASVRFNAPLEAGLYEGSLLYEVETETEGGTLSGIGVIEARARVE